jgi:hypothetical protein
LPNRLPLRIEPIPPNEINASDSMRVLINERLVVLIVFGCVDILLIIYFCCFVLIVVERVQIRLLQEYKKVTM